MDYLNTRDMDHANRLQLRLLLRDEAIRAFGEIMASGSLGCSLSDDVTYGDRCTQAMKEAAKARS